MKVVELESYGFTLSGTPLGGTCTFDDGKTWSYLWMEWQKDYVFNIDSGLPCIRANGNYSRLVRYPKRIKALKEKLAELGELN